ncbi:MAG: hypothetical protein C0478_07870 [Planctomyces sp.]|nr:hypothetical protein [Planctomyces sp.]
MERTGKHFECEDPNGSCWRRHGFRPEMFCGDGLREAWLEVHQNSAFKMRAMANKLIFKVTTE